MKSTVLYLYSEIGPYNIPVLRELVEVYGATVHVISWDTRRLKPYDPPELPGVVFYRRSDFTPERILDLVKRLRPSLAYVSGWMDTGYFPACRFLKTNGIPVVTGFDDQWLGTIRQRVGQLVYRCYYNRYFSHAWVSGARQYEFAKRLGFSDRNIVFDMLSGDIELFLRAVPPRDKALSYPHKFLYVGNFRAVKGTDILVAAYGKYRSQSGGRWGLLCIGNGELLSLVKGEGVEVLGFTDQTRLTQICGSCGVFILPSRRDKWGVVVHEFAAAGLPLILSENVGARSHFLVDGFNGITYKNNSVDELARAMTYISGLPDADLVAMGANSRALASRITPRTSAANLMATGSIICSKPIV
jgi:glycosyltransferase involved in cell wall biosynthesis